METKDMISANDLKIMSRKILFLSILTKKSEKKVKLSPFTRKYAKMLSSCN